jgi:dissimilatory sulfite reductase (desulfoviridin) alpha/beta subunit
MQWTPEAEAAVKKVPFFVRKRVRARVEDEARQNGKTVISLTDVTATQKRYLTQMSAEIKGYQVEACFGPSGCPNRAVTDDGLIGRIESLLQKEDLIGFLKSTVAGSLKFHHEFRVAVADCPNACSQPQIKDIGIIGACRPSVSDEPCTRCAACLETCKENALCLEEEDEAPQIDHNRCVACGQCVAVCSSGTLMKSRKGYRVQLGGKLGRHPQLARELPGIFSVNEVLTIISACIRLYKLKSSRGRRFGEILTPADFERLAQEFKTSAMPSK